MRLEIGGDGDLRGIQFPLRRRLAMISAGRKCVLTITSQCFHPSARRNSSDSVFRSPAAVCRAWTRPSRLIHQVVDEPEHVRRTIDQIEIGLAIDLPEGGIGEREQSTLCMFASGASCRSASSTAWQAHVAGADRGGEDKDILRHEIFPHAACGLADEGMCCDGSSRSTSLCPRSRKRREWIEYRHAPICLASGGKA